MSHMFEQDYESTTADNERTPEPGRTPDPPYHDYLATHRSTGESSSLSQPVVWIGVLVVALLVIGLGVAAYLYLGG